MFSRNKLRPEEACKFSFSSFSFFISAYTTTPAETEAALCEWELDPSHLPEGFFFFFTEPEKDKITVKENDSEEEEEEEDGEREGGEREESMNKNPESEMNSSNVPCGD